MVAHVHLDCSLDEIAFIKAESDVSFLLEGIGDTACDDGAVWLTTIEIKTKVAATALGTTLQVTRFESVICDIENDDFHCLIAPHHITQVLQKAAVTRASHVIYDLASETGNFYTVVAHISKHIKNMYLEAHNRVTDSDFSWAHKDASEVSSIVAKKRWDVVQSRWFLSRKVNDYVKTNGPFRTLKVFTHGIQSYCSKKKGGVEDARTQQALLRRSSSRLSWEQNLASQVLKTVSLNAFTARRAFER